MPEGDVGDDGGVPDCDSDGVGASEVVGGGVVVEEGVPVVVPVVGDCDGVEEGTVVAVNDVDADGLGLAVVGLLNGVTVEIDGVVERDDVGGTVPEDDALELGGVPEDEVDADGCV